MIKNMKVRVEYVMLFIITFIFWLVGYLNKNEIIKRTQINILQVA
ncbi:hypothetical protein JM98_01015 [Treponema putidum]|nr:hypothetical protein JM98_01015 [Treponema putidum]